MNIKLHRIIVVIAILCSLKNLGDCATILRTNKAMGACMLPMEQFEMKPDLMSRTVASSMFLPAEYATISIKSRNLELHKI